MIRTEAPPVYELVTEKPWSCAAYQVRDYDTDPTIDIKDEARRLASLHCVAKASVEFDWSGETFLVVVTINGKTLRPAPGTWIVTRPPAAGPHPFDADRYPEEIASDGQVMGYTDSAFRERYLPAGE